MKRLLKVFAFLGGLGAVGWLIRNRFVDVTLNREPETPEPAPEPTSDQETPEPAPEPTSEPETPEPNSDPAPESNSEPETQEPAPESNSDPLVESDLLQVPGIARSDAELLGVHGVTTAAQLAEADPAELAARTGLEEALLTSWIEQSAALV